MKKIVLKVDIEKHILHTITLWSGYYSLTPLETSLIQDVIRHYLDIKSKTSDSFMFDKVFIQEDFRAYLRDKYEQAPQNITKYIQRLVKKRVLYKQGGTYKIDERFIPTSQIVFEYRYE